MKTAIASLALLSATLLQANVSITVIGTVNTDPTGTYTAGDPVSITFDVNLDPLAGFEQVVFNSGYNWWSSDNYSGGPLVLDNISSPQLGGTYSIDGSDSAPDERISTYSSANRIILVNNPNTGGIGLTLGTADVTSINFSVEFLTSELDLVTGTSTSVSDYFAGYEGSYSVATTNAFDIATSSGTMTLDVTDMTIVPEPATSALFLGFIAAGMLIYRRRKLS